MIWHFAGFVLSLACFADGNRAFASKKLNKICFFARLALILQPI